MSSDIDKVTKFMKSNKEIIFFVIISVIVFMICQQAELNGRFEMCTELGMVYGTDDQCYTKEFIDIQEQEAKQELMKKNIIGNELMEEKWLNITI